MQQSLPSLAKANLYLKVFGFTKIPMIWFCRPRIMELNEDRTVIRIKLNRRTRNHLKSMYFGTLSVGADICGGFMAFMLADASDHKISLVFKDFKAEFLQRPTSDVDFICEDGKMIKELVNKVCVTGEREEITVNINAFCPKISEEKVADFKLTLSLKSRGKK